MRSPAQEWPLRLDLAAKPRGRGVPTALALGLLSACGAGTAAVVAGSGDSGGGGTTPALELFAVESPKVATHCRLRLAPSAPVRVALFYDRGQGEQALTQLDGVTGNEVDLPAGERTLGWDFASEPGIATTGFTPDVRLRARLGASVIGGGELTLGLGNDAPKILSLDQIDIDEDEEQASGTTGIELTLSDSSADVIDLKIEFDVQGDEPDAGWQLARPGLLAPGLPTPDFGVAGVQVATSDAGGTRVPFFWATDEPTDLKDLERDVQLRFTATDGLLTSTALLSGVFRVDNNAEPIVQVDSGPLILNPDERRGIPIPFRVIDEEGDLVEVIFQWRREGEAFPSLDTDGDGKVENGEVERILADRNLRQLHHVCSKYPRSARGRAVPIDEDSVRLPELAMSASWVQPSTLAGKTLELLRPWSAPRPIGTTWLSNPLVQPVAALPVGDGRSALVLDAPGAARLREIVLATGRVVKEIAAFGPGIPSTMAFEHGEKAVLVALDDAGAWRIERVELASGARTELAVSDDAHPAPVRGIASLGTTALVFTAGSALHHLDYRDALAPRQGKLLDLANPWGVVVDPLSAERLYVAECDANRILAIELDTHGAFPLVVRTTDLQTGALEAPRDLAVERGGARMLAVSASPGGYRLVGLDPGAIGGNRSFAIGDPFPTSASHLATGPDGLRLLCLPSAGEILVAGGIEQRRTIRGYSTATQEVSVDPPFDPAPRLDIVWRLDETERIPASRTGISHRFLWDSRDAYGGRVRLQAIVRDDEMGAPSEGEAPKRVGRLVEQALGGPGVTDGAREVAVADLDGDGDLDLVSVNSEGDDLTLFFQLAPGGFASPPVSLGGPPAMDQPVSVVVADLDGDGDMDLATANERSSNLTVFHQLSSGVFSTTPLVLGLPPGSSPRSIAAADLDADGDQDLVAASPGQGLILYHQLPGGVFADPPLTLDARPFSIAVADLDSDGDLDLASANGSDLTVFFQVSPGNFSTPLTLVSGETVSSISIAAADLDGDGDMDLVAANQLNQLPLGGILTLYFQTSPGTFAEPPVVVGESSTPRFPSRVGVADLDGDGDQDLVLADSGGIGAFFQLAQGAFARRLDLVQAPGALSFPIWAEAADLEGDGDPDLVSIDATSTLRVSLTARSESWPDEPLRLSSIPSTLNAVALTAGDFDADGALDIASGSLTGHLDLFFQSSIGEFASTPLTLAERRFPLAIAGGDLDGDGDQDLVSVNSSESDLTVFFQHLPGVFLDPPLTIGGPVTTDVPMAVALADFDGDGDLDIVSANVSSSDLTVFHQDAPGSYVIDPIRVGGPAITRGPVSVVAADLDSDGDVDLVAANQAGNDLTVFRQTSPSLFVLDPLPLGGPGVTQMPASLAAADVDQDGHMDLISANAGGDNLSVFLQRATGGFQSPPLVVGGATTTRVPRSLALADLDGDGAPDIVSANALGNDLTVFRQLTPGTFSLVPLILGGPGTTDEPNALIAVDLDGDGDPDLATANGLGNDLTIFFSGR